MKSKESIREEILNTKLIDVLSDLGSALEVADRNHEILAAVAIANDINAIHRIIESFTDSEYDAYEDERI